MRDLAFVAFLFAFIGVGFRKPFLFVLCFCYIDIVAPQRLSYFLINSIPISLIGALPAAAAGQIEDEAAADIASDVGTDLRDSTQSVMQDYLAIRPVIHVDQGTRITVMVDRDLEIF